MFDDILGSASNLFHQAQENIGSIAGPFLPFGGLGVNAHKNDPRSLMGEDLTGGGAFGMSSGLAPEAAPWNEVGGVIPLGDYDPETDGMDEIDAM